MNALRAVFSAIALALASSAVLCQSPERIPNRMAGTKFPHWMRPTNVTGAFTGNLPTPNLFGGALTIDSKGIVYLAGEMASPSGEIGYTQRRWDARGRTGFSQVFNLSNTPSAPSSQAAIAHGPQDEVYVVWQEQVGVTLSSIPINSILRRKMTASGWEAPVVVATGSFIGDRLYTYGFPRIDVDAAGGIHIAVREDIYLHDATHTMVLGHEVQIRYRLNQGNLETVAAGRVMPPPSFPYDVPGVDFIVQADSTNTPHVAWHNDAFTTTGSDAQIRHRKRLGVSNGSWTGSIDIVFSYSTSAAPPPGFRWFDFDLGPTDREHYAYQVPVNNDILVRYRWRTNAGVYAEEGVSGGGYPFNMAPQLVVDSRDQPHVLWRASSPPNPSMPPFHVCYAARVQNPLVPSSDRWFGRQEPIDELEHMSQEGGIGLWQAAISRPNDVIHFVTRTGFYSRQYEPNLGAQDGYGISAWGPGTAASAVTGNVSFALPLFSSHGVGFAASPSLVYNTLDFDPQNLSLGWRTSYSMTLTDHRTGQDDEKDFVTVQFGDGRYVVFQWRSPGGLIAEPEWGNFSKIERNGTIPGVGTYPYVMTTKLGTRYGFRADGKLKVIADTQATPNTMTLDYDPIAGSNLTNNQLGVDERVLSKITDSVGRPTTFSYDNASNQLQSVVDPGSQSYALAYDSKARLATVTFNGVAGVQWKFEHYDQDDLASGHKGLLLAKVFTPRGTAGNYSWEFFYNQDNRAQGMREPGEIHVTELGAVQLGQAEHSVSHDASFAPYGIGAAILYDRRNNPTHVVYEYQRALVTNVTDALNNWITRTFDPQYRNLVSSRDERGFETRYTYHTTAVPSHVKDNVHHVLRPKAATTFLPPIVYTYTSDDLNRVDTVKDSKGATTDYDYHAAGNQTKIKYPPTKLVDGSIEYAEESFTYDNRDRMRTHTDARGGVTTNEYDDPTTGMVTASRLHGQSKANAEKF